MGCLLATAAAQPTLVVLNKAEATASLLDPTTGKVRATAEVGEGPHEVAVSRDGRTAVVCDYGGRVPGSTLSVVDVEAGRTVRTIELVAPDGGDPDDGHKRYLRPHGIVYLPDGEHVAVTAEAARRLLLVHVPSGEVVAAIPTRQDLSHMVALTPDAKRAFVANIRSGSVSVLDLEKREHLDVVPTGDGAEGIAVHPERGECWVTNRGADTVSIVDTESLEVLDTLETGAFPIRIAFTPDGARALVSNARDGTVTVYDTATREPVAEIRMDAEPLEDEQREGRIFAEFEGTPVPIGILVQPDGRRAYVANTQADVITVLDLGELAVVDRFRAGAEPDGMAWAVPR